VKRTTSIEIAAPPRLVFDLAHDVRRWADLLPHYVSVTVLRNQADGAIVARFVAVRPLVRRLGLGLPITWRAVTWNEPDTLALRFRHLGGATSGMDVTWRIAPTPLGTRVQIEHDFGRLPRPWAVAIGGLFVDPVARRTLATFKSIAEAVEARSRSAGRPTAN